MGASPLRTTSNGLKISFGTLPELKDYLAPSCTTIKRWVQQVGYYKLNCTKTIANDWMVLIDSSIQMGQKKCVLVVGCRQVNLPKNRALKLEDLEVLAMRIVSTLNGDVVTEILLEVALLVGKIASICSDRGSEIVRGVKDFQLISPETRHVGDTAHRVSNLLEVSLEGKKRWISFRELVTWSRRRMQNSRIPGALPPSPRTKARYMNIDALIKWASDMLILLDHGVSTPQLDMNEFRKYLGWLSSYREDIEYWNRIISIGVAARQIVRIEGIHTNVIDSFEEAISSIEMGFREQHFADQLMTFLLEQSKGVKLGERFIGSTEVLESLFGKMKYMEHEQTAFGFTSLVLAGIACVGPTDEKTIVKAMTSVRQDDVEAWTILEIGQSIQSQRRKIQKTVASLLAKMGQEVSGNLERVAA